MSPRCGKLFSLLDSAIAAANSSEDSTGSLDPTMVKAVFLLCASVRTYRHDVQQENLLIASIPSRS